MLGTLALAWGGTAIGVRLVAALLPPRARPVPAPSREPASFVIPLMGKGDASSGFFHSLRLQLRPGDQVLICCEHADDEAVPAARAFIDSLGVCDGTVLIGGETPTGNPKLNNMAKGLRAANRPLLVLMDGGLDLPADIVGQAVALLSARVGLVSVGKAGVLPVGAAADLECAFLNGYQLLWIEFLDRLHATCGLGGVQVLRASTYQAMGGLDALAATFAEDHAAAVAVARLGLATRVMQGGVPQPLGRRALREVWGRQLRWAGCRRRMLPGVLVLEGLAGMGPALACVGLGLAASPGVGGGLAGVAVLMLGAAWVGAETVWLKRRSRGEGAPREALFMIAREILIPFLVATAWVEREVLWRGRIMRFLKAAASSEVGGR
ncbi:glycosyltransferase [Pararhodospirillum oryzae]|uniref:Ceramide glucosyltransferase n=1 Tax=Pararhodospirillum oryzae TaxID=478448 RepID=A0A512HA34_9PROT|nr:glycosyltransferase [Pararhodospirillum oryzae]GEO82305.1 ceramide glucosyltransferase [Pararhodospirillum oryzae]